MTDPPVPEIGSALSQDVKIEESTPPQTIIGDLVPHGQFPVETITSDKAGPSTATEDSVSGTTGPSSFGLGKLKLKKHETLLHSSEFRYIRGDSSIENLETGMMESLRILEPLKELLRKYSHGHSENRWIKEIETLKQKSETTRVIVGVVGTTGAGKSSLINALLDEERLVPTSSMRACTAVVTEISFNHGPDRYRAEIDFVSPAEWEAELKLMFQDIESEDGDDSEVAIARAKMGAVYPEVQNIRSLSVEELMKHKNVSNILGRIVEISDDNSTNFFSKLQNYVDSKTRGRRKIAEGDDGCGQKAPRAAAFFSPGVPQTTMGFWPLIRVVRLYVKAPVLTNGAVIVDLPGLQDSNAARAAVASRYIEQCSSIWIVSPITRAVDDRTAKTLLGDAFKRQIQMDGAFNRVTFICTKTDDFNSTEMQESLDLDEIMEQPRGGPDAPFGDNQKLEEKHQELKDELTQILEALDELSDETGEMEILRNSLELQNTLKDSASPGKRQRVSDCLLFPQTKGDFEQSYGNAPDEQPAYTAEQKLRDASNKRKQLVNRKRQIHSALRDVNQQLKIAQEKKQNMYLGCILGRNQISKSQIQRDFADGIRQLDQADAEELDAANFDPSVCKRDYDEIASSLPVFCVSSKGYQKLQGRFRREPPIRVFGNINDTEIPLLQAHCNGLSATQYKATCQAFLNNLEQLLNSLELLSSSAGSGGSVCEEETNKNQAFLDEKLRALQQDLKTIGTEVFDEMMKTVGDSIFHKFGIASSRACNKANNTLAKWNRPRNEAGVAWNTYRALCRRRGVYNRYNWNKDLAQPMMTILGRDWEICFSHIVPRMIHIFAETSSTRVEGFHADVDGYVSNQSGAVDWPRKLKSHLQTYSKSFDELSASCIGLLYQIQKGGSRVFVPTIADALKKGYSECGSATGKGVLLHMKDVMARHVEEARHEMFNKSTESVKSEVEINLRAIKILMATETDNILKKISWDYQTALNQTQSAEQKALGEELSVFLQKIMAFKAPASAS